MQYVCECGAKFNEEQEGVTEHVLEQHLDLVETRFEEFLDSEDIFDDLSDDEVYDEAVEDVTDDLLDLVPEA